MSGHTMNNADTNKNGEDSDKCGQSHNAYNYCKDFIRGFCPRETCRFMHETPPKHYLKELFRFCHDFQNKGCFRQNCKFVHSTVEDEQLFYATGLYPKDPRNTPICQAYIHGTCTNQECKYIHPPKPVPETMPQQQITQVQFSRPPPFREEDTPPETKYRRLAYEENGHIFDTCLNSQPLCINCESLDYKVKLLHDNICVLLKKIGDLSEKNLQLTSMNEFLLQQTASIRTEQSCVITSRHGTSAPVSLATVSVTPVVSLAGALPALVPATANPNLTLAPAASRAQILTPAPLLAVSTTQQLVGNSGTLIVTSAGAQQLMQVSDSGTLMGAGQTVVAVTPAQLTIAPQTQQLISSGAQTAVQQLVQQSAQQLVQPQLASQHQATQFAAQQSVQHLAAQQNDQHLAQHLAQQSAQHLAAQQSAQHLAAQQNAQHLAAQQNAQHLAAQQNAQHLAAQQNAQHLAAQQNAQHLAAQQTAQHLAQQSAQHLAAQQSAQHLAQQSAQHLAAQQSAQQQLVHQNSTQQITISTSSQPMAMPNSQAQPITFPMMSQNIIPH